MTALHTRTLFFEAEPQGDELSLHAELLDVRHVGFVFLGREHPPGVVHRMTLDVAIDRDLVVRHAEAAMATAPFETGERTGGEVCRDIVGNYRRLVGMALDGEYALRVLQTLSGPQGCFHLLSLAQCLPTAVAAATGQGCGQMDRPRFRRFRRDLRISCSAAEGAPLRVRAEQTDRERENDVAGADLEMDLELPGFRILRASASLAGARGAPCERSAAAIPELGGSAIVRGFTAAALERIGGVDACTHVAALLIALTPVTAQAAAAFARSRGFEVEKSMLERRSSAQIDSCHMWRADGPLVNVVTGRGT